MNFQTTKNTAPRISTIPIIPINSPTIPNGSSQSRLVAAEAAGLAATFGTGVELNGTVLLLSDTGTVVVGGFKGSVVALASCSVRAESKGCVAAASLLESST